MSLRVGSGDETNVSPEYNYFRVRVSSCTVDNTIQIMIPVVLACAFTCLGARHDLEAEHADIYTTRGSKIYRTAASGGIAVKLFQTDYVVWPLNITCASLLVQNVRYSSYSLSDEIELQLNGTTIGSFRTEAVPQGGESWNVFKNSGVVGKPVSLLADQHALKVVVGSADEDGVEIDKVTLNTCISADDESQTITIKDIIGWIIGATGVSVAVIFGIIGYRCRKKRSDANSSRETTSSKETTRLTKSV